MKAGVDAGKPVLNAQNGTDSMVCTQMKVKWNKDTTLELRADRGCVIMTCNNFEARASTIDARQQDGVVAFVGNVTINYKMDGTEASIKSDALILDMENHILLGRGGHKLFDLSSGSKANDSVRDFEFLNSAFYQIPVLADDQLHFVIFNDSGTTESDPTIKDHRVSVGAGLRIVVPMPGPVPISLDFGIPTTKRPANDLP
jgi:Omp85 superfamily domain